jgi:serine/threonine-protein kinase HipA
VTTLSVHLFDREAGVLERLEPQSLDMRFEYSAAYRTSNGPALSVSLPLRDEPYIGAPARNWFANLLPEAAARQHLAASLGLPIQDDFALLEAVGRECAGAVSIVPAGTAPPSAVDGATRPLEYDRIEAWVQSRPRSALFGDGRVRLSLAGAQDKIGVILEANGSLSEPLEGAISTHILKAPNPDYPGLVSIEALGLRLARAAHLAVPDVSLARVPTPCLVVERFDRVTNAAGAVERVHEEDFCQALGLPPEHKYQAHGGPSFARCFALVRELGIGAPALASLIDWAAFTVAIGNADAHGKNVGLLHHRDRSIVLAPFYDLVPTCVYPALDRELAMFVGTARTVDDVEPPAWQGFASDCGLGRKYVERRLMGVVKAVQQSLDLCIEGLVSEGAEQPALEKAHRIIDARCDALLAGEPLPRPPDAGGSRSAVGPWGMSL